MIVTFFNSLAENKTLVSPSSSTAIPPPPPLPSFQISNRSPVGNNHPVSQPVAAPPPPPPPPPSAAISSSSDRTALLNSIHSFNKGALKKAETKDYSVPKI